LSGRSSAVAGADGSREDAGVDGLKPGKRFWCMRSKSPSLRGGVGRRKRGVARDFDEDAAAERRRAPGTKNPSTPLR
jgi:hypothetical protein